jgi:hypothetical protein
MGMARDSVVQSAVKRHSACNRAAAAANAAMLLVQAARAKHGV